MKNIVRVTIYLMIVIAILLWIISIAGWLLVAPGFEPVNVLISVVVSVLVAGLGWLNRKSDSSPVTEMGSAPPNSEASLNVRLFVLISTILLGIGSLMYVYQQRSLLSLWFYDWLTLSRNIPDGYELYASIQDTQDDRWWVVATDIDTGDVVRLFVDSKNPSMVNGKLVFERILNNKHDIYIADFSTHRVVNLTKNSTGNNLRPSLSPDTQHIAYECGDEYNFDICIMNLDGTDRENITRDPADDKWATWSPDGKYLMFQSERSGTPQIYLTSIDMPSVAYQLTANSSNGQPNWSWSTNKIAFVSYVTGNWDVWVMNPDGSFPSNITSHGGDDLAPSWASDGNLLFVSTRNVQVDVFSVRLADRKLTRLLSWTSGLERPVYQYSNDTASTMILADMPKLDLVFSRAVDSVWQIYRLDDNKIIGLTDLRAYSSFPKWSPDGSKILFHTVRDGNSEIYVMNADGTNPTNLSRRSLADAEPSWSPDGKKIAWTSALTSDTEGEWAIYMMNDDGTNIHQLTETHSVVKEPVWSPDGRHILYLDDEKTGVYNLWVLDVDGREKPKRLN